MYITKKIIYQKEDSEICIVEKEGKTFLQKKAFSDLSVNMLKNEVNILNFLMSKEISPKVIEFVFNEKENFAILEFIDGTLLFDYDFVDIREKFIVISKLCHVVSQLHSLGIIHGDLKPENIFITRNNEIKLIDFGISVNNGKNYFPDMGTTVYCSYEHLVDGENLNFLSDLYSIGIIFYELITGELPFQGSKEAIVKNKLNASYKPTKNKYINLILDRIFNINNLNRYNSVDEFKEELDVLLS